MYMGLLRGLPLSARGHDGERVGTYDVFLDMAIASEGIARTTRTWSRCDRRGGTTVCCDAEGLKQQAISSSIRRSSRENSRALGSDRGVPILAWTGVDRRKGLLSTCCRH